MKKIFIFTLIASLTLLSFGVLYDVYAKYVKNLNDETSIKADGFYISSNYLTEEGIDLYNVSNWTSGFQITFNNFDSFNNSLISSNDISYGVRVEKNGIVNNDFIVSVTDNVDNAVANIDGIYVLSGITANYQTITFQPRDGIIFELNSVYKVFIEAVSPYEKKISASFKLVAKDFYETSLTHITDNGDYYLLKIVTNAFEGNIDITCPLKLIPDNANPLMESWIGINGSFIAESYHTYEFIYFNPEGGSYIIDDFSFNS